ncbi:cytochrome P450 [Trinickia sp. NRRL B-1857]
MHHDAPSSTTASSPSTPKQPLGVWPPGPFCITGWGLLNQMSRDMLGTLSEWKRRFGDVVHLRILPSHAVVVTDPELMRDLLVTHHDALVRWERARNVFAQVHGNSVLVAEGETWRTKRHAMQPSFSPKAVQVFLPTIADTVAQTLAHWPARDSHWSIESELTSLTMDVIMRMTFSSGVGSDARIAEEAIRVTSVAVNKEFFWPVRSPDWVPWKREKRRAIADLDGLVRRHLQARLIMPPDTWPDDLLTMLLKLHKENPSAWPLEAVRDECMTTFLAGHETTAAALVWWAWCMASNPVAQTAAREEVRRVLQGRAPTAQTLPSMQYLTQTIKEALRLYPVVPVLLGRVTTKTVPLGQWQVPAGAMFMLPVQLMHHDPRWFPEPEVFRPERFAPDAPELPRGVYMPFGTGPRVCLGQNLAMAEMTVIAAMLLQRFDLSVPEGMAAPRPTHNVTLRPAEPMQLAITEVESA